MRAKLVKENLNESFTFVILTAVASVLLWKLTWKILEKRDHKNLKKQLINAIMQKLYKKKAIASEYDSYLVFSYSDSDFRIRIDKIKKILLINDGNYDYTPASLSDSEYEKFLEIIHNDENKVNEAIKHLTPRSEEELERNRGSLNKRIAQITGAIEDFASRYNEDVIINDEDPEYFSAGFKFHGNYYGIGVNPANDLPFEAQFENGKNPENDEVEVATIEDAFWYLSSWIIYAQKHCSECGTHLDSLEQLSGICDDCFGEKEEYCEECGQELNGDGNCPNCNEENDEDE